MTAPPDFTKLIGQLEDLELTTVHGRITQVVGMLIKAVVPNVKMGEVCLIKREGEPLIAEVVGFTKEEVFLSPLGELYGVGPTSEVIPTRLPLHIKVGPQLLGRVLNGLGQPLDVETKGPLHLTETFSVINPPPDPLKRNIISTPLSTGVRAIDGVLTAGQGQRIGIFAAAGGGKSTLLGMIARYAEADVNVISLIGERGREVREFIEHDLGEEGLARSVIIVSTSDQAAQLRLNAAYVGTAIAEYFREQGKTSCLLPQSFGRGILPQLAGSPCRTGSQRGREAAIDCPRRFQRQDFYPRQACRLDCLLGRNPGQAHLCGNMFGLR